ncbi:MAG: DEAD/DEAH box helicase, partial [Polaromonas sp.]
MATRSSKAAVKKALDAWFATRGWKPFAFQREVWQAIGEGRSGLLHATTGAGKTYAVWLGALMSFMVQVQAARAPSAIENIASKAQSKAAPLTVLWITPMRALAADTLRALQQPLDLLSANVNEDGAPGFLRWTAGARSGDTAAAERSAQNRRLPTVLVTTPESLSLLLSRADAKEVLGSVKLVVVDEWHELLGNKRGVQVQLALARLKLWSPSLVIWGMSATLGNLDEAMQTLLGHGDGVLVQGQVPKKLLIDSLLPARVERFPWGGHLGLTMLPQVIGEIEKSSAALVFTNTRSQAEIWYQALLQARPDWAGLIALHHGSLDRAVREWVELGLKNGALKAVVCTSSLDLGVDFLPVERVLQIGSPKGVAR